MDLKKQKARELILEYNRDNGELPNEKETEKLIGHIYSSRTTRAQRVSEVKEQLLNDEQRAAADFEVPTEIVKALMNLENSTRSKIAAKYDAQLLRERKHSEDLVNSLSEIEAELIDRERIIDELNNKNVGLANELNRLETELNVSKNLTEKALNELRSQLMDKQAKLEVVNDKVVDMKAHLKFAELEAEKHREQLEVWKEDNNKLQTQNADLRAEIAGLKKELEFSNQSNKTEK